MGRVFVPLAILAAFGLVAAACGDDQDALSPATRAPAPSGAAIPTLDGRTFLSTEVTGHDLVEGSVIRLAFEDGSLSANAGCNQIFGGYQVDGNVLVAGMLGQTQMACDEALMDQDRWLSELLSGSPTLTLAGAALAAMGLGLVVVARRRRGATA